MSTQLFAVLIAALLLLLAVLLWVRATRISEERAAETRWDDDFARADDSCLDSRDCTTVSQEQGGVK